MDIKIEQYLSEAVNRACVYNEIIELRTEKIEADFKIEKRDNNVFRTTMILKKQIKRSREIDDMESPCGYFEVMESSGKLRLYDECLYLPNPNKDFEKDEMTSSVSFTKIETAKSHLIMLISTLYLWNYGIGSYEERLIYDFTNYSKPKTHSCKLCSELFSSDEDLCLRCKELLKYDTISQIEERVRFIDRILNLLEEIKNLKFKENVAKKNNYKNHTVMKISLSEEKELLLCILVNKRFDMLDNNLNL